MGLKEWAYSKFQRVTTTEILGNISHELCDAYLDDVIDREVSTFLAS